MGYLTEETKNPLKRTLVQHSGGVERTHWWLHDLSTLCYQQMTKHLFLTNSKGRMGACQRNVFRWWRIFPNFWNKNQLLAIETRRTRCYWLLYGDALLMARAWPSSQEECECVDDTTRFPKKVEIERMFEFMAELNCELDDICGRVLDRRTLPLVWEVFIGVWQEESLWRVMLHESPPSHGVGSGGLMHLAFRARTNTIGIGGLWCLSNTIRKSENRLGLFFNQPK